MGLNNLTLCLTFHLLLLLACTPGRAWADDEQDNGSSTVSRAFQGRINRTPDFHCWTRGYFHVTGSCRDFYYCDASGNDLVPIRFTCPPNTVFRVDLNVCHPVSPLESLRPECVEKRQRVALTGRSDSESMIKTENVPIKKRLKRFTEIKSILTGLPALTSLAKGSVNGKRSVLPDTPSKISNTDLTGIENRLSGMDARLKNIDLQVFLNKLANKTKSDITQNLISGDMENKWFNSKKIQYLISQGILETRIHTATTQGLLRQGSIANELNFARVHANIGNLEQVIVQEINRVHSEFEKGYRSISDNIDQSKIKQLLSNLLTTVRGFNERTNLLQSSPETDMKDEIERNGGYTEFLESSTLKDILYDIIYQKLAIPKHASDDTAKLILELVIQGLQIQRSLLSSVVLSNVYLAGKALEEKDLEDFNVYISRVSTATRKMRSDLGDRNTHGLIKEVKTLLYKVEQLPYVWAIQGLREILTEKYAVLTDLESEVEEFITANTPMGEPGQIQGRPTFRFSSASLPIGSWETGQKVRYAVQLISDKGLSKIGEWSHPYTVTDKANPIIHLPRAETGVARILYRQFREEKPEIVAILTDENETAIRDIGRDMINAAARLNEDLAVAEVRALIIDGVDVNATLENDMSPLHYAAKRGNLLVMKLLVNESADIHAKTLDNEEVLHFAALSGNEEAVSYIVNEGATINAQTRLLGWSPLHIAVANSHVGAAKVLIENEAFMNIRDNRGLTPLHLSVLGNGETMETLLKEDTLDVNAKADGGLTALHYAVQSSKDYYSKRLLKHKDIDVNSITDDHLSPLHYAAMSGNAEIITELVTNGASAFLTDNYGSSPLHYAAFYGNKETALVLSERFPDLKEITNNDGKTAFDLAVENNREEIIQILRDETKYLINLIKEALSLSQANQTESNSNTSNHSILASDESSFEILDCVQLKVKELAVLSEDTCLNIGQIVDYVRVITSSIPLSHYYEMPQELAESLDSYNSDIQEAKRNANVWRNQNSIMKAIKQAFHAAKEFETTFNMKYDILKERLASIIKNTDKEKITAELREEKSKLERKLQETQEVLLKATAPIVKKYLEQSVTSLQLEIENKQSLILTDPSITHRLEEFVDFLSFVRDDASGIKQQATIAKQRIIDFRDTLEADRATLEKHKLNINKSLKKLQQQSVSHNSELLRIQQRQEELEAQIKLQKKRMWDLSEQTYNTFREMRNKRRELIENIGNIRFKTTVKILLDSVIRFFGSKISAITGIPVDTLIDQPLLEFADHMDRHQIEEWQNTIEANRIATENLNKSIELNEQLIVDYRKTIANDSRHSETLTKKLNTFNQLSYDLQSILIDIPNPQPSVKIALSGVEEVEALFSTVTQEISDMISTGQSASTAVDKESALRSIHNRLSDLQCNWKDARLYIVDLRECS